MILRYKNHFFTLQPPPTLEQGIDLSVKSHFDDSRIELTRELIRRKMAKEPADFLKLLKPQMENATPAYLSALGNLVLKSYPRFLRSGGNALNTGKLIQQSVFDPATAIKIRKQAIDYGLCQTPGDYLALMMPTKAELAGDPRSKLDALVIETVDTFFDKRPNGKAVAHLLKHSTSLVSTAEAIMRRAIAEVVQSPAEYVLVTAPSTTNPSEAYRVAMGQVLKNTVSDLVKLKPGPASIKALLAIHEESLRPAEVENLLTALVNDVGWTRRELSQITVKDPESLTPGARKLFSAVPAVANGEPAKFGSQCRWFFKIFSIRPNRSGPPPGGAVQ